MFAKHAISLFLLFQFTLSVDVDLVTFNVTVLDSGGRSVTGLRAENFRIYEDGRPEPIKLFQPEDTPSTVGIVIDNSGSMMTKRSDVILAALAFVKESHPDDEMFVVNFSNQPWLAL